MGRCADFSAGRSAVFSAIAGIKQSGGNKMDNLEEVMKAVNKLTADVASLSAKNATTEAENILLKAKVGSFEATAQAQTTAAFKAETAAKRTEIEKLLEAGVKAGAITPGQREQFTRLIRLNDDEAVKGIDIEEVKLFTAAGKRTFSQRDTGHGSGSAMQDSGEENPAETVASGIADILAKKEATTHLAAQLLYFKRNPKLAREYVDSNNNERRA
jgi:regulator of replication initiation timing